MKCGLLVKLERYVVVDLERLHADSSSLTSYRSAAVDLIFRHLIVVVADMVADFIVWFANNRCLLVR